MMNNHRSQVKKCPLTRTMAVGFQLEEFIEYLGCKIIAHVTPTFTILLQPNLKCISEGLTRCTSAAVAEGSNPAVSRESDHRWCNLPAT